MVVTKNQIRPRRRKFHFTNAEILLFDTTGFVTLIAAAPLGHALRIDFVEIRTNIVQVYGAIDAAGLFGIFDDFAGPTAVIVENDAGISTAFSELFGQVGLNLFEATDPQVVIDSNGGSVTPNTAAWTNEADLAANGGLGLFFSNGGADLNGGDVLNYMDIFIDYKIINL